MIRGVSERHQVRSLNHGIGFDTAAIERGCEVAAANLDDAASLAAAFEDVAGVFVLPPSEFDPLPGFPEARAVIDAVMTALESAHPRQRSLRYRCPEHLPLRLVRSFSANRPIRRPWPVSSSEARSALA